MFSQLKVLGRLAGVSRPMIAARFLASESGAASKDEIQKLLQTGNVVVFMKGTPQEPMCGFSNAVCKVLEIHGVDFKSHNVLENDDVRQGVKEFSDWPTIPQLYVNGKFVGGCDILVEMHQKGELSDFFTKEGIASKFAEN